MNYYPVFLNLHEKDCLVVGGGNVAARKVLSLLDCGARVRLVSPVLLSHKLVELVKEKKVKYLPKSYDSSDIEKVFLVISATDNENINRQVAEDCFKAGKLVNVVDNPKKCNFFVPALVRRGSLSIAVSTGGKSPLLAAKISKRLEKEFLPAYGEILELLGKIREKVIDNIADPEKRKIIFNNILDGDTMELLENNLFEEAKERIMNAYRCFRDKS